MKKTVIVLLGMLVVIIAGGVFYFVTHLDALTKAAIEKYGSDAIQTAVRVDNVAIKLAQGSAAVRGLTIANPQGFSAAHAFSLGEISITLNTQKTSQAQIVMDRINIQSPVIYFEINAERKGNLNIIKDNISGSNPSQGESVSVQSSKPQSGEAIKLSIARLTLNQADLKAKVVPLKDKTYELTIPPLELRNLQGTPEQITRQVFTQIIDHAGKEIKRRGIDAELVKIKADIKQKISDEKAKAREKAETKLQSQEDKAKDKLKSLIK